MSVGSAQFNVCMANIVGLVLLLFVIEQNDFWVVPRCVLLGQKGVRCFPGWRRCSGGIQVVKGFRCIEWINKFLYTGHYQ